MNGFLLLDKGPFLYPLIGALGSKRPVLSFPECKMEESFTVPSPRFRLGTFHLPFGSTSSRRLDTRNLDHERRRGDRQLRSRFILCLHFASYLFLLLQQLGATSIFSFMDYYAPNWEKVREKDKMWTTGPSVSEFTFSPSPSQAHFLSVSY